jgi:DNA polymerase-3 subunit epsilon
MPVLLRDLEVLVLDCQAGGATPAHGDLLEIGWGVCAVPGLLEPVHDHWIVPRTQRRVPRAIRELTGWNEACVQHALPEHEAWSALQEDIRLVAPDTSELAPTVIHFARFELPFLRDLHDRHGQGEPFPFDTLCLHAIAARLFPDLPRRNIRALAGYLGHSTDLIRRSAGHVIASAHIWRALVPLLEPLGVDTWSALRTWLGETPLRARSKRRIYPLAPERRHSLPERAGVYRFLRCNGDLLYVGKAANLKRRVASHFSARGRTHERALELLTQVHSIDFTQTASILEAALLESDEIKRLDPPYNVQLRAGERQAWFAARDLRRAIPTPDTVHCIGPLPSQGAISSLHALIALADGAEPSAYLRAVALSVPMGFVPDGLLFAAGWRAFAAEHLTGAEANPARRIDRASRSVWHARGRAELSSAQPDTPPDSWDLARVLRRLERNLVQSGLLVRRARWLCLLAAADVAYRERDMGNARGLAISRTTLLQRHDLESVANIHDLPMRRPPSLGERQASFDAAGYDRLRVLATELQRVLSEGGEVALRFGAHVFTGQRLLQLMASF